MFAVLALLCLAAHWSCHRRGPLLNWCAIQVSHVWNFHFTWTRQTIHLSLILFLTRLDLLTHENKDGLLRTGSVFSSLKKQTIRVKTTNLNAWLISHDDWFHRGNQNPRFEMVEICETFFDLVGINVQQFTEQFVLDSGATLSFALQRGFNWTAKKSTMLCNLVWLLVLNTILKVSHRDLLGFYF